MEMDGKCSGKHVLYWFYQVESTHIYMIAGGLHDLSWTKNISH